MFIKKTKTHPPSLPSVIFSCEDNRLVSSLTFFLSSRTGEHVSLCESKFYDKICVEKDMLLNFLQRLRPGVTLWPGAGTDPCHSCSGVLPVTSPTAPDVSVDHTGLRTTVPVD